MQVMATGGLICLVPVLTVGWVIEVSVNLLELPLLLLSPRILFRLKRG
jgi:hypothetical protein